MGKHGVRCAIIAMQSNGVLCVGVLNLGRARGEKREGGGQMREKSLCQAAWGALICVEWSRVFPRVRASGSLRGGGFGVKPSDRKCNPGMAVRGAEELGMSRLGSVKRVAASGRRR